jgi:hypothetical protein
VTIEGGAPSANHLNHLNGGAIYDQGALRIAGSLLDGNSAGGEGGAVDAESSESSESVTVLDSTLANNVTLTAGGALADAGNGVMTLIDDTFDGNKATSQTGAGGALAYLSAAGVGSEILNVTIAHNTAPLGGGIYMPANAIGIENTIVAENSDLGTVGGGADCYGGPNEGGGSEAAGADLGANVGSDATCFSEDVSNDVIFIDPNLSALADNGGQTPTDALPAGSSAISRGIGSAPTCSSPDQRGLTA